MAGILDEASDWLAHGPEQLLLGKKGKGKKADPAIAPGPVQPVSAGGSQWQWTPAQYQKDPSGQLWEFDAGAGTWAKADKQDPHKGAWTKVEAPAAAAGSTDSDALAMQMFFSHSIAPYLDKLGAGMKQTADQWGSEQNKLLGQVKLPPGAADVIRSTGPSQIANYRGLADSLAGSTLTTPYLNELLSSIKQARAASLLAEAQAAKAQASGDLFSPANIASFQQALGVKSG